MGNFYQEWLETPGRSQKVRDLAAARIAEDILEDILCGLLLSKRTFFSLSLQLICLLLEFCVKNQKAIHTSTEVNLFI